MRRCLSGVGVDVKTDVFWYTSLHGIPKLSVLRNKDIASLYFVYSIAGISMINLMKSNI